MIRARTNQSPIRGAPDAAHSKYKMFITKSAGTGAPI